MSDFTKLKFGKVVIFRYITHFRTILASYQKNKIQQKLSHQNQQNWAKIWVEGGQKQKIDNIDENNEVSVIQFHKYVLQVGRSDSIRYVLF